MESKSQHLKKIQKTIKDLILFDSAWKKRNKATGIKKEAVKKLEIYRTLVKNTLYDILNKIYPYTKNFLKKGWNELLSRYIEDYPPKSPILNKVAEHFPEFLSRQKNIVKKYPFISELAKYEWLEVEIYERDGPSQSGGARRARRRTGEKRRLILNPVHEICHFQYHIPEIVQEFQKHKKLRKVIKKPTNVLIYRDPEKLNVRIFELSEASSIFIELMNQDFSEREILETFANAYNIEKRDFKKFERNFNKLINDLKKYKILISQTT